MPVDDRALLRDLRAAIESTEGAPAEARQEAIRAAMNQHGATLEDVARLLQRARSQHRTQIRGLASRLEDLIARKEEGESTVQAVEEFLRGLQP